MVKPLRSTAYLGPDKGRWSPATWADVVEAAAGGLIDESHWVDLKQELPAGKATVNTDLAKDLASLAVDGGLLLRPARKLATANSNGTNRHTDS